MIQLEVIGKHQLIIFVMIQVVHQDIFSILHLFILTIQHQTIVLSGYHLGIKSKLNFIRLKN